MTDIYATWACEKTCPICGKVFIARTEEWAYKVRYANTINYYCSWHCFRENSKRKEGKGKRSIDRAISCGKGDEITKRLLDGMRPVDICRELEVCHATVNYWKNKLQLEGAI